MTENNLSKLDKLDNVKLVCIPTICAFKSVGQKFVRCKVTGEFVHETRCLTMECSQ